MKFRERLEWVVRMATVRPALTLALTLALALAGGIVALGLHPSAATSTFVSSSDPTYRATADQQRHFGSDAVVVLIREPLTNLVQTKDLATVSQLEACLAGQSLVANDQLGAFVPASASAQRPYGGAGSPCAKLMATRPLIGSWINLSASMASPGEPSKAPCSSRSTRPAPRSRKSQEAARLRRHRRRHGDLQASRR